MHGLRGVKLFEPGLIGDMHATYYAACRKLGLSSTSDKATSFVVTKVIELAKTGLTSDELTAQTLRFFDAPSRDEPRQFDPSGYNSDCAGVEGQ
jgi:hypothetical protein